MQQTTNVANSFSHLKNIEDKLLHLIRTDDKAEIPRVKAVIEEFNLNSNEVVYLCLRCYSAAVEDTEKQIRKKLLTVV